MLCCVVLCCVVLCCAVLCCAVLCCAVLCSAVLCYAMLCYVVPCIMAVFIRLRAVLRLPLRVYTNYDCTIDGNLELGMDQFVNR